MFVGASLSELLIKAKKVIGAKFATMSIDEHANLHFRLLYWYMGIS